MSTSFDVILKRLFVVFVTAGVLFAVLMLFSYDLIKIEWPSFMEIQPSYRPMENPLPPPDRSIPVEGPIAIPGMGAPQNPVTSDQASITRGAELYRINCKMCHGDTGQGDGQIAAFLQNKPANLTSALLKAMSDGAVFLTITKGVPGRMPPLNENLTVRERWDVVNFIRTLKPPQQ